METSTIVLIILFLISLLVWIVSFIRENGYNLTNLNILLNVIIFVVLIIIRLTM
jgi:hypothetical protein|nr:MAG TPA: hypothetical protein [Caudoviricetes sp.]